MTLLTYSRTQIIIMIVCAILIGVGATLVTQAVDRQLKKG